MILFVKREICYYKYCIIIFGLFPLILSCINGSHVLFAYMNDLTLKTAATIFFLLIFLSSSAAFFASKYTLSCINCDSFQSEHGFRRGGLTNTDSKRYTVPDTFW